MSVSFLRLSIYNTVPGLIRILSGIITIPALIKITGPKEYGIWVIASSLVNVISLAEGGLSTAATVFVAEDAGSGGNTKSLSQTLAAIFVSILVLSTVCATGIIISSDFLSNTLFGNLPQEDRLNLGCALKFSSIVVWTKLVQQIIIGVSYGFQRYGVINLLISLQAIVINVGLIVVAFLGGRAIALMEYQAMVSLLLFSIHAFVHLNLTKSLHERFNWSYDRFSSIAKYCISVWIANLGATLFTQVDKIIVGAALGATSLAGYSAITSITSQINSLSAMPIQPLLPKISSLTSDTKTTQKIATRYFKQATEINCLISFGMGGLLVIYSSQILDFIIGKNLSIDLVVPFRLCILIYSIYSINASGYYYSFAIHDTNRAMKIIALSGFISLLSIYIGCNYFGVFGAIFGNIGYIFTLILNVMAIRKLYISGKSYFSWIFYPTFCFLIVFGMKFLLANTIRSEIIMLCIIFSILPWFLWARFPKAKLID